MIIETYELNGTTYVKSFKIVRDKVNVAGGNLPKDFSVKINITFIYDDCPLKYLFEQLSSGQSDRVRTQTILRAMTPQRLLALEKTGYSIKWSDINTGGTVIDLLLNLTPTQFYARVVGEWGFSREEALRVYGNKHAKTPEEVNEIFKDIK